MQQRTSNAIYAAKSFAVLSIISAHCAYVSPNFSKSNLFCSRLLNSFGSFGVGIFLFFAGFFMFLTKSAPKDFFLKKLKTLLLPWLFCGTLVYLYVYIRKGGYGIKSWCLWILGYNTYLYYMSVLFLLYIMCFFFRKNGIVCYLFIAISLASNILTTVGRLNEIQPYLNPFNFLIYFSAGLLVARHNMLEKIFTVSKKYLWLSASLLGFILLLTSYFKIEISYFKYYFLPIEFVAFFAFCGISYHLSNLGFFINIGKASFAVYLLHMPIAGITANLFGKIDFFLLTLIRPFVVLIIVYSAIKLLPLIFKNNKALSFIYTLIGMR